MNKKDGLEIVAGLLLGLVGFAILLSATNPKCPKCKNPVKIGISTCQSCGSWLSWK